MRIGILVVVLVGGRIVSAAPESERSAAWQGRPQFAVRAGVQSSQVANANDAADGHGPWADVEAGFQITPCLTLSGFLGYEMFRVTTVLDRFTAVKYDVREDLVDTGARATLRIGRGPLVGLGIGFEHGRTAAAATSTVWKESFVYELVAGYALPISQKSAFQIFGLVSYAPYSGFFDSTDYVTTTRIGLGLQF
ncbi:MAG: hypothetical protein JWO36_256 [Myxococcales bacterium]|nr:hypothetical protein [Myxococcales bacterium]